MEHNKTATNKQPIFTVLITNAYHKHWKR